MAHRTKADDEHFDKLFNLMEGIRNAVFAEFAAHKIDQSDGFFIFAALLADACLISGATSDAAISEILKNVADDCLFMVQNERSLTESGAPPPNTLS
jgi:hypothetical protein